MMRFALLAAFFLLSALPAQSDPVPFALPAGNTTLIGCVEGRALRIVNGQPSCASTAPPTLSGCGTGTIDAQATDYIGQVTVPAGATSCTIVMTQLYATTFICLVQSQGSGAFSLSGNGPVLGNNGTKSTLAVPFTLTTAVTKFGYICGPG